MTILCTRFLFLLLDGSLDRVRPCLVKITEMSEESRDVTLALNSLLSLHGVTGMVGLSGWR